MGSWRPRSSLVIIAIDCLARPGAGRMSGVTVRNEGGVHIMA
jgi:hypothetical protein